MQVAEIFATLSHDKVYQVGAVIVKEGQLLAQGWNGMPAGMDNTTRDNEGTTRPEVIHAEANAIAKLAKTGGHAKGATIYTTHSPCYICACLLLQSGIERVVYDEVYDKNAINFLRERGIAVESIRKGRKSSTPEGQGD